MGELSLFENSDIWAISVDSSILQIAEVNFPIENCSDKSNSRIVLKRRQDRPFALVSPKMESDFAAPKLVSLQMSPLQMNLGPALFSIFGLLWDRPNRN